MAYRFFHHNQTFLLWHILLHQMYFHIYLLKYKVVLHSFHNALYLFEALYKSHLIFLPTYLDVMQHHYNKNVNISSIQKIDYSKQCEIPFFYPMQLLHQNHQSHPYQTLSKHFDTKSSLCLQFLLFFR